MDDSMIIVSLDIGTTAMKVVVANVAKGQINVIGIGSAHSKGMNRGVIVDIDKASEAIREAVKKAASQSNTEVHDIVVGLPANGVQISSCQGTIALGSQTKEIEDDDVQQVMSASLMQTLPAEQEYVALIPND
ncbi:cell division protein FtsA, partial [Lactobacillus sp. XV13L]|nr:cell division protein FtsA [Lactobacillus sp. XV13L]